MSSSLFRKEALEHQKDRLMGDVLLLQPLPLLILTGVSFVIMALIVALLFWGTYARKETALGYLVPDRGIVKIFSPGVGTLSKVHVQEGQHVKAGQPLFTLLSERSLESGDGIDTLVLTELKREEAEVRKRIVAETELEKTEVTRINNQINGFKEELEQITEELSIHDKRMAIAKNRIDSNKKLFESKVLSGNDYEKLNEEYLSLQHHKQELLRSHTSKKNAVLELQSKLEQLPLQLQSQMSELEKALSGIKQRSVEIEGRRVIEIRAPIDGIIDGLQVNEGQWLNTMQTSPLVALIPEDSVLLAEIFVPTRSIGFMKVGQKVNIRYDAFPYQRYGLHEGTVFTVSQHILHPNELPVPLEIREPVYRIVVALDKQSILAYGNEVYLQAGMSMEVDIILDQQSLFDWVLDPLYSLKGRV